MIEIELIRDYLYEIVNHKEVDEWLEPIENEIKKLKQAIDILKDKIELPLENDFDVVNKDDVHLYRLRTKCLINEEEYELLKEVLGNE